MSVVDSVLALIDPPGDRFPEADSEDKVPTVVTMPDGAKAPDRQAALSEYVSSVILPQIVPPPHSKVDIERLCQRIPVYLFVERGRNATAVGKLFQERPIPPEQAWSLAETEYRNLSILRGAFEMGTGACQVVAPLGKMQNLSALLVTQKVPGHTLDYYIAQAVQAHESNPFFDKLGYLASFFVKVHRNSESAKSLSPNAPQRYLSRLLASLGEKVLSPGLSRAAEMEAAR